MGSTRIIGRERRPTVRRRAAVLVPLAALLGPLPAGADDTKTAAGFAALAAPGSIAIMRHALAPGVGDPVTPVMGDCTTQRNLDAAGRAQSRAIGEAINGRGIVFDQVLAGAWCRAWDTAVLMDVGEVVHFEPLDDVYHRLELRDDKTAALKAFLAALPDDERVLLVTHQLNITGLTGLPALSGEIIVIDVASDGAVSVKGHIVIPPPERTEPGEAAAAAAVETGDTASAGEDDQSR